MSTVITSWYAPKRTGEIFNISPAFCVTKKPLAKQVEEKRLMPLGMEKPSGRSVISLSD